MSRIDTHPNVTILSSSSDTTCTIEHPGFGKRSQFSLVTSPLKPTETNSQYSKTDFEYHVLGRNIATNWPKYGYNHIDKVIYTNTYDDMECYDIVNLDLLNSVGLNNLIYQGEYSCPTNSTQVATVTSDKIKKVKMLSAFPLFGLGAASKIPAPILQTLCEPASTYTDFS